MGKRMDKIHQIWPAWHTVELIGRGGFGEVYKAKREQLGEVFYSAVKIIRIPKEESEVQEMLAEGHTSQSIRYYYESVVKGLMNEIKVLDALKSAGNVVNIEEFEILEREDSIGWDAYIRMELLQNLNAYRQEHPLHQREVAKLGADLCEALICCEQSHIIHRDIKPSNIFVDKYGTFKLGDFGIARQMEKTQGTLSRKGTDLYMAPEVRYGKSGSSYNVDLYSLGLVMYRLLNKNRMPFEPIDKEMMSYQEREEALMRRLEGEQIPLPADCDSGLGEIICKACEYDKDKRYQRACEMKKDLEAWIRKEPLLQEEKKVQVIENIRSSQVLPETEEEKTVAAFGGAPISDRSNPEPIEENEEISKDTEPERKPVTEEAESREEKEKVTDEENHAMTEEERQLGKKADRAYTILTAFGIVPLYFIFQSYVFTFCILNIYIDNPFVQIAIVLVTAGMLLYGTRRLVKKGWCKSGLFFCLVGGYFAASIMLGVILFYGSDWNYMGSEMGVLIPFLVLPVIYKLCGNLTKGNRQLQVMPAEKRKLTLCAVIPFCGIYNIINSLFIMINISENQGSYGVQILKNIVYFIVLYVLIFLGQHLAQKKKTGILLCTAGGAVAGYMVSSDLAASFAFQFLFMLKNYWIDSSFAYRLQMVFLECSWIWYFLWGTGAVIGAVLCYKWSKKIWKTREIGGNGQD